jgi:Na+-translocating ferredoxin:NAD+ oxidoreductase RnfG subunit
MFAIRNKLLLMVVGGVLLSATTHVKAQDDGLTESPDGPEAVKVYFTLEEALAKVFDKPDSTWSEVWEPTEAEISELENQLGWRVPPVAVEFHRAQDGEKDLGWAVVTEEKGRFKPITFMVQVAPDGRVQMVLVMVYRESRGEGVKRQRFLKQFRKKDTGDHLRLNRDIVGVSGATLSSRAITAGVKRVLAQVQMRYQKSQEGP